jgi:hypothetical protein
MDSFSLLDLEPDQIFKLICDGEIDRWDFFEWLEIQKGNIPTIKRLVWTDLDGVENIFEGSEDEVDRFTGELMNTFWDATHGWSIEWHIEDTDKAIGS